MSDSKLCGIEPGAIVESTKTYVACGFVIASFTLLRISDARIRSQPGICSLTQRAAKVSFHVSRTAPRPSSQTP
jgi:hypothetical protein